MNRLASIFEQASRDLAAHAPLPEGSLVWIGGQCGPAEIFAVFVHIQQLEAAARELTDSDLGQEDIRLALKNFSTVLYGTPSKHAAVLAEGLANECRAVRMCTASALKDRCAIAMLPALRAAHAVETDARVKTEIGAALEACSHPHS
ncbi:hypothetical protein ACSFBM_00110 [Variovorax sp. GB1R11]|uniref:hypothetical protein n=1 Tax=Variovorax sp. GB1R11 TaxID=3443741 RepID=UPI003F462CBD